MRAKPPVTKQVEKANAVNASMQTGKGTSKGTSGQPGTGNAPKTKTPEQRVNKSKSNVKKAKASQKGKETYKLKGKTKNSTENMKGRKPFSPINRAGSTNKPKSIQGPITGSTKASRAVTMASKAVRAAGPVGYVASVASAISNKRANPTDGGATRTMLDLMTK